MVVKFDRGCKVVEGLRSRQRKVFPEKKYKLRAEP